MILAIISHTAHYYNTNGQLVGWGPTVREVNHLTEVFDKIIHVACLHEGSTPAGMLPYESPNIEFVPLKPSGGDGLAGKLDVIFKMPHNRRIIKDVIHRCDVFQFRAPTGMGVYTIPYLLRCKKKGWFKYAGNWMEAKPPLGNRIQRYFLKRQNKYKVTINGHWPDQKPNQLSFENPCLTQDELYNGNNATLKKDFSGKLNFAFVGRLEDAKGVHRFLHVLSKIDSDRMGSIHLIGDGPKRSEYEVFAKNHCKQNIIFHGFLRRDDINTILETSHVFVLPSDSEGFPKVVAEAANYGLIPIVSDVSCIGQYIIDDKTGFLILPSDEGMLYDKIQHLLQMNTDSLQSIAVNCHTLAEKFTYDYYNKRIKEDILI